METPAVPLLAEKQHSGYNNCFVLGGKVEATGKNGEKGYKKIRVYIDEEDKVQWLKKEHPFYHSLTHLSYDEANTALLTYRKKHTAPWGRVSLWLENAKYNDLYIFVIDFDKIDGNIDTESPFFKGALQIADKVTRSQGGGYHMFYGVDKDKAEPLFDGINLLASRTAKSFVCKTMDNVTLDGRNKADFFCDTPHFIYEWEEWDNNAGLTDKTQELYELIKANFEMTGSFDFGVISTGDADNGFICIEEMSEEMLLDEMTTEQRLVFADLKNISCECSPKEWFSVGINIWHVFGDELGGSVFHWWSKPGHSYNGPGCATTWGNIDNRCMGGTTRLNNSYWRSILGLDISFSDEYETPRQAEIQQQLKELGERIQAERQTKMPADNPTLPLVDLDATAAAEPLTFRGLPIQWEHENVSADNALDEEEQSGNAHHRILWGAGKYKRDDFFRAIWGADYKKVREKAIFKGAAADNILRLTTGQRTALEYDALYHRHIDDLVLVGEQDEKELFAFFASDDCSTATETLRRLNFVDGAKKIATFGAGRQQTGAAEFTWCYTKEAVKVGNRYRGVALDWSLWAYGIETAYNDYLRDKDAKLWDKVRPAMYCQYQRGEVCRMTYAAEDYQ